MFLIWEYFKRNQLNPVVRRRTLICIGVELMGSLYFIFGIFVVGRIIDLLQPHVSEKSRSMPRTVDQLKMEITFLIILLLALFPIQWNLCCSHPDSLSRKMLQVTLLQRLRNPEKEIGSNVRATELAWAMTHDIDSLVNNGYLQIISLVGPLSKSILLLVLYSIHGSYSLILIALVFAMVMYTFARVRNSKTLRVANTMRSMRIELMRHVEDNVPWSDVSEQKISSYEEACRANNRVQLYNKFFMALITGITLGVFVLTNSMRVLNAEITLGSFIWGICTLVIIGAACNDMYCTFLSIQSTLPACANIRVLMDLPNDDGKATVVGKGE